MEFQRKKCNFVNDASNVITTETDIQMYLKAVSAKLMCSNVPMFN